jgi:cytochrome c-type biogenesis protein CcmH
VNNNNPDQPPATPAMPATPATPASDTTLASAPASAGRGLWIGVGAFVVAVAAAGYLYTGKPEAQAQIVAASAAANADAHADAQAAAASAPFTEAQLLALIDKLKARLDTQPDDSTGWTMLGRSYAVLGRAVDAQAAFERALQLKPNDAGAHADVADAMAAARGGELEGEPLRLVQRALQIDPDHLKSLAIAGTAAFDANDFAAAARHWGRIATLAPAGSDTAQRAQAGVDEAQRRAGLKTNAAKMTPAPAPAAASGSTTAAAGTSPSASSSKSTTASTAASVSGTVSLAPALRAQAAPDDTVFIFARAASGSRMPLAILRRQVKELPVSFTLDDRLAMAAGAGISSQSQVVVGARISKTGQAMPQPGDLEGFSAPVAVGSRGLQIEISRVLP